jgi:hypothetical protein
MPWYEWVFDGVGGGAVVSLAGWLFSRVTRKPIATAPGTSTAALPGPPSPSPAPVPQGPAAGPPVTAPPATSQLVDLLLAIPGMNDPDFRRDAYGQVPQPVVEQIRMSNQSRIELLNLIATFEDYPHLAPWQALLDALRDRLPAHPAVRALATALAARGLTAAPPSP